MRLLVVPRRIVLLIKERRDAVGAQTGPGNREGRRDRQGVFPRTLPVLELAGGR